MSDKTLEATDLGIKTSDILEKYIPDIVKEDLTRHFEEEMEKIREKPTSEDKVLDKAKKVLTTILKDLANKEDKIGTDLKDSLIESQDKENTIGECPQCKKGTLKIKYSPKTKQYFLGCSEYPDCKAVYGLPGNGRGVQATNKTCEACGFPLIKVGTGRHQQIVCFNMKCPIKVKEEKKDEHDPKIKKLIAKPCPECGGELKLRKSVYGEFIGCSGFPKCRFTERLDETTQTKKKKPSDEKKNKTVKTTTKKKTTKKTSKKKSSK